MGGQNENQSVYIYIYLHYEKGDYEKGDTNHIIQVVALISTVHMQQCISGTV